MEIIKFLETMFLMMITEGCCTMYLIYTEKRQAIKSGLWCSATVLFTSLTVVNYVENNLMIIAAVIGAFFGSFIITKIKK